MKEIILKVEDLSKQYRLGNVGSGSLVDDFKRFSYRLRGKEDPFLKIGETNDRSKKGNSDYVWALKDINFEVNKGDVIGIIGRNGAGKSTLLKILSKVTGPTTGSIKYNGKIASLLEVGTGFNGEMTGRENVFLNGAILGMTKKEITSKLDDIIDFSGCERYIDTPVKRYSSGMTVRLAFAVAAFLEPDILIVDEVLAVGDAEFQKKAIGKMKDISASGGRTVLFVSHNMASVKNLCKSGIVLGNGQVEFTGTASKAVEYYLSSNSFENKELVDRKDRLGNGKLKVTSILLLNEDDVLVDEVISCEYVKIRFHIEINEAIDFNKMFFGVGINDSEESRVLSFLSDEMGASFKHLKDNIAIVELTIPKFSLREGVYNLGFQISENGTCKDDWVDVLSNALTIGVIAGDYYNSGRTNRSGNYVLIDGCFD